MSQLSIELQKNELSDYSDVSPLSASDEYYDFPSDKEKSDSVQDRNLPLEEEINPSLNYSNHSSLDHYEFNSGLKSNIINEEHNHEASTSEMNNEINGETSKYNIDESRETDFLNTSNLNSTDDSLFYSVDSTIEEGSVLDTSQELHILSLFESYNQALELRIKNLLNDSDIEEKDIKRKSILVSMPRINLKTLKDISLISVSEYVPPNFPFKPFTIIENYFSQESSSSKLTIRSEDQKTIIDKVLKDIPLTSQEKKILQKVRVNLVKQIIWEEYRKFGYKAQFERDGEMWLKTLENGGFTSTILQRVFTVIRYGGLLFKEWNDEKNSRPKWHFWRKRGWPIASALSHGSRVIIQLDRERISKNKFWNWLITGDPDEDASIYISTSTTSEKAQKGGKYVFKRLGATHSLDFIPNKMQFNLPANRKKIVHEIKTFGLKDSKVLAGRKKSLASHSHWGMNIPMGGLGEEPYLYTMTKNDLPLTKDEATESVDFSGKWGHMYIYFLSPNKDRFGGIMIGVENSEPNVRDSMGENHSIKAKSPLLSPTFGYKWWKKGSKPDLRACSGPAKYNGLLVDLSEGWEFLMKRAWKNEYVKETSEKPRAVPALQLDEWLYENSCVPTEFDTLL